MAGEDEAGEPEVVGTQQIRQSDARLGGDTDQRVAVRDHVGLALIGVGDGGKRKGAAQNSKDDDQRKTTKYSHAEFIDALEGNLTIF